MLKLSLNQPYTIKNAPIVVGSYQTGAHEKITVGFDLEIPAGFSREQLRLNTPAEEKELFERVVVGWSKVADADGIALPFNDENKRAVLALDAVKLGLVQALGAIAMGQALEKN